MLVELHVAGPGVIGDVTLGRASVTHPGEERV
jgi:hypothetical protein